MNDSPIFDDLRPAERPPDRAGPGRAGAAAPRVVVVHLNITMPVYSLSHHIVRQPIAAKRLYTVSPMFKWRDDDRTPHRLAVPRLAAPIRPSAARNGATAPGGAAGAADLAVQARDHRGAA